MSALLAAARRLFARRPLLANCATYGALYAGAEFSQQTVLRKLLVKITLNFKNGSVHQFISRLFLNVRSEINRLGSGKSWCK